MALIEVTLTHGGVGFINTDRITIIRDLGRLDDGFDPDETRALVNTDFGRLIVRHTKEEVKTKFDNARAAERAPDVLP